MNKKIEILYKEKNKVDDSHFCLLNVFDTLGYCHSPQRGLKNITTGCCQNLCSFYKDMNYSIVGFIDFAFLVDVIKDEYKNIFVNIIKTIQEIEAEANK
jgi:hypothetical protein